MPRNLPDGLKDLLKSYERRQIAALGDNYVANQTATKSRFYRRKLLKTAEWNQNAPIQQVYAKQLCNRLCSNGWSHRDENTTDIPPKGTEAILIPGTARPSQPISEHTRLGKHACQI